MKYKIILLLIIFPAYSLYAQNVEYFLNKAFENSPVLKSQLHKTNASHELYKKESVFSKNPVLNIGYSNVPISEWPSLNKHPMSGINIGISQYIASPWEDTYRKRVFYQKYLSEKEAIEETKNLIAFQVQSAYHNILFMHKKKQVMNENKQVLSDVLRLAESLVSVNKMNSSQLLKIKADIFSLTNKITELDGKISKMHSNMEMLCGITLEWIVTDELLKKWIDDDTVKNTPAKFNVKNHPLYKRIHAIYEAQIAAHKLEIAKINPGATFGLDYRIRQEVTGKDEGEDFISFKASIPIPLFYVLKEHHSIKASREKENETREMLRSTEIDLITKWKGESNNHSNLLKSFSSFENDVLPGYLAAYKAHIASLSAGTVNLLDVLDTYRLYLNSSLDHARVYKELNISKLRLNYLLHDYPNKKQKNPSAENSKK